MVLGQLPSTPNNKLPSQRLSSPVRAPKDHRCSACRLIDPPTKTSKYFLETCPHKPEFAPSRTFPLEAAKPSLTDQTTVNPFSPLTAPKWDFDYVHKQDSGIRRRGRRGGKRQKQATTTPTKQHEDRRSDSIDEICKKIVALRLSDHGFLKRLDDTSQKDARSIAIPSPAHVSNASNSEARVSSYAVQDSVRHHWAPQFRPNTVSPAAPKKPDARPVEPWYPMSAFIASPARPEPETLVQQAAQLAALRSLTLKIAKSANAPLLLTAAPPSAPVSIPTPPAIPHSLPPPPPTPAATISSPAPLPTPPPSPTYSEAPAHVEVPDQTESRWDARSAETFGADHAATDLSHRNENLSFEPRPGDGEYLLGNLPTMDDEPANSEQSEDEWWNIDDTSDEWDAEWDWEPDGEKGMEGWASGVEWVFSGEVAGEMEEKKGEEDEWDGVSDWFL